MDFNSRSVILYIYQRKTKVNNFFKMLQVPASPAEKADNTGSSSTLPGFAGRPGVTDENGDTITSGNFYSQIPGVEPFNCVDLDRCASPNKKVRVATVNPERRQETPSKLIGSAGSSAASQSSSDAGQKETRMTEADLFDDDDEVMDETYTVSKKMVLSVIQGFLACRIAFSSPVLQCMPGFCV